MKKATIRKEQEPDFEEKRFHVTIGEDEREFDKENDFFRERSYRIIREWAFQLITFVLKEVKATNSCIGQVSYSLAEVVH